MKQGETKQTNMKSSSKKIRANKIVYVDRWLIHFGKDKEFKTIMADQLPNGMWACEIELPLVNEKVKALSSDQIKAMVNVAEKATKLIQDYLKSNPDVKWPPLSKFRHYEIEIDEFGFVTAGRNSEYRKKDSERMLMIEQESIKAVKKAVSRIKRLNGSDKDLFIQVIDRSLFDKDATNDEIFRKIFDTMYDQHNIYIHTMFCDNDSNHITVVGFTSTREEFEKYFK